VNDFSELELAIGYIFHDKTLLRQALTHPSYSNEHKDCPHYERLEFLGDAVLDYIVGLILFETFPDMKEEFLTKFRAGLVQEKTFAEIADKLRLTDYLRTSGGKQVREICSSSAVKCDIFESVIGAVLLDSDKNIALVKKIAETQLAPYFHQDFTDYKSVLLEYCAKRGITVAFQSEESIVDKKSVFHVSLWINGAEVASLDSDGKKKAEKELAKNYFQKNFYKLF